MVHDFHVELELYERYRNALVKAKRDVELAQADVEKYRLAVNGLTAVIPDELLAGGSRSVELPEDGSKSRHGAPRGEDAVRVFLEENPNRRFKARELTEALIQRGWINADVKHPESATRQAGNRLRRKDPRFKFEDGAYSFRSSGEQTSLEGSL